MRPIVRYWRGKGLKAVVYLDDGLCAVKGREEAREHVLPVNGCRAHCIEQGWW